MSCVHHMCVCCVQVSVRKGDTIGGFLKAVREQLAPQFRELRAVSVDSMMYVKVCVCVAPAAACPPSLALCLTYDMTLLAL